MTLDDLGLLLGELVDLHAQWYHLGIQLRMRNETLDRIAIQFHDPRDQLLEVLKTWLTTSDNPSWKTLTDVLKRVGESRLAGGLERKYCLKKDMRESKH